MKFDVDDKNRCRLVYVKFHLNRCRFAAAVAKCLGGSLFGTQWGKKQTAGRSGARVACNQVAASRERQRTLNALTALDNATF